MREAKWENLTKETYFKCFPNETNIWLHYWQCCLTKHISFYIADAPHRAVTVIRVRLSILYFILLKLYTILPEWGDPQGNRRHYKCQCLAGHLANGDLFCQIYSLHKQLYNYITLIHHRLVVTKDQHDAIIW